MKSDECVFVRGKGGDMIWLLIYVDDILVMGLRESNVQRAKRDLKTLFKMKDMGPVQYFLGVEFKDFGDCIVLSQEAYLAKVLKKFGMDDGKSVTTPMVPGQDWTVIEGETDANVP